MSNSIKRICAWVLTIVMIAGVFPVSVFAAELDDTFQMDINEALVNGSGGSESAQEPAEFSATEPVGGQPEVKQEAEQQFSDTEEKQEAAGADYGSGTDVSPAAEESASDKPAAQPSSGEDEPKKTAANSQDAREKDGLTTAPASGANQAPKYEELLINRQYEMTYVDPEEPIVFRMEIEKEQNIHFAAEGMDLTMNIFNERTKESQLEEPADLLDGEDNAWCFAADSYLFAFYSKAAVSGTVILRIMDDETAEGFFYPEGTLSSAQAAGDFNSFLDKFFSNENNETVDLSDTDFPAIPFTDTVTVGTPSLIGIDQDTPENASPAPDAEPVDILEAFIGSDSEVKLEPEAGPETIETEEETIFEEQVPDLQPITGADLMTGYFSYVFANSAPATLGEILAANNIELPNSMTACWTNEVSLVQITENGNIIQNGFAADKTITPLAAFNYATLNIAIAGIGPVTIVLSNPAAISVEPATEDTVTEENALQDSAEPGEPVTEEKALQESAKSEEEAAEENTLLNSADANTPTDTFEGESESSAAGTEEKEPEFTAAPLDGSVAFAYTFTDNASATLGEILAANRIELPNSMTACWANEVNLVQVTENGNIIQNGFAADKTITPLAAFDSATLNIAVAGVGPVAIALSNPAVSQSVEEEQIAETESLEDTESLDEIGTTNTEEIEFVEESLVPSEADTLDEGKFADENVDDIEESVSEDPESTPVDEPAPEPKAVTILSSLGDDVSLGAPVTLTGVLEDAEEFTDIIYIWEVDKGNGYEPVPDADGPAYTFHATVESLSWNWRLSVYYK